MEDKKIKECSFFSEENNSGIKEKRIEEIKNRLNDLRQDLAELNNYRDRWTDFDVAVICWLLAHNHDELKFWKKLNFRPLPSKRRTTNSYFNIF